MIHLPTRSTQIGGPLIVILASTACVAVGSDPLAYEADLAMSEPWRLITGNLAHLNTAHLLLNLAGVLALWLLHGDYYRVSEYLVIVTLAGLGTTLGLLLFSTNVAWYVGLSGALHGLFSWGVVRDLEARWRVAAILAAGLVAKLVMEWLFGGDPATESLVGAPVITSAHLFGAVTGALVALTQFALRQAQRTTRGGDRQR